MAVVLSSATGLLGCRETTYVFFDDGSGVGGTNVCADGNCGAGSGVGGDSPGTGGASATGATTSSGGAPAGGQGSMAGAPSGGDAGSGPPSGGSGGSPGEIGPNCESPKRDVIVERLQLAVSGMCVAAGMYAPIDGEAAYDVALVPCEEALDQSWTIQMLTDSLAGTEFRNEDLNLNLDTYRAEPNDGTPIVLYLPHRFANQRYSLLSGADDTFRLAPLHAPTKCLTESEGGLVLMTCDSNENAQNFRRIACR